MKINLVKSLCSRIYLLPFLLLVTLIVFLAYFSQNYFSTKRNSSEYIDTLGVASKDWQENVLGATGKVIENSTTIYPIVTEVSSISKTQETLTINNISEERLDNTYLVIRVIDGDTIELSSGEKVRYIGIDTPETVHPDKTVECFGYQAKVKNEELVLGKRVVLEKDVSEKDRYGRLLRYVYVGDIFVNEYLVREGFARSSSYPPDVKHQEKFIESERKAREEEKGLWGACSYFGESIPSITSINEEKKDMSETTKECLIKGNISSNSKEKIYHFPGCGSYEKTVIDENKGEKWFCAEEEAVKAGFRKAGNCP